MARGTLRKPPPRDANKSQIENDLDVVEVGHGSNIFSNRREAWQPPAARGIYGGSVIAMCLASAQKTVPSDFVVHSLHSYFLLAGSNEMPILFHVDKVRDGRSFATRTVQARQQSRCVFTTTMSFVRAGSAGPPSTNLHHASTMPVDPATGRPPLPPPDSWTDRVTSQSPIQSYPVRIVDPSGAKLPASKRTHAWFRARGPISAGGGLGAHLLALAYLSDHSFIGTVARHHDLWRWPMRPTELTDMDASVQSTVRQVMIRDGQSPWMSSQDFAAHYEDRPALGMIVSLDHTIYFHDVADGSFRADEWMFSEMKSPWAGDGRGLVLQKIYSKGGILLATCVQEGLIRLRDKEATESKL